MIKLEKPATHNRKAEGFWDCVHLHPVLAGWCVFCITVIIGNTIAIWHPVAMKF